MLRILAYLLELLALVLILRAVWQSVKRFLGIPQVDGGGRRTQTRRPVTCGETARDPVCGTFVSTALSFKLPSGKETFHFCSRECLERFQKAPS